jgi:sterol desaturase/sphingolipid hydroxylase (fatty acid hydroxylase superfamily)
MNWKEFLKPDWRKTTLFVVITFIIPLVGMFAMLPIFVWLALPVFLPVFSIAGITEGGPLYSLTGLLFSVIIWIVYYIFSCFVIWIYDKYLKKVKK